MHFFLLMTHSQNANLIASDTGSRQHGLFPFFATADWYAPSLDIRLFSLYKGIIIDRSAALSGI